MFENIKHKRALKRGRDLRDECLINNWREGDCLSDIVDAAANSSAPLNISTNPKEFLDGIRDFLGDLRFYRHLKQCDSDVQEIADAQGITIAGNMCEHLHELQVNPERMIQVSEYLVEHSEDIKSNHHADAILRYMAPKHLMDQDALEDAMQSFIQKYEEFAKQEDMDFLLPQNWQNIADDSITSEEMSRVAAIIFLQMDAMLWGAVLTSQEAQEVMQASGITVDMDKSAIEKVEAVVGREDLAQSMSEFTGLLSHATANVVQKRRDSFYVVGSAPDTKADADGRESKGRTQDPKDKAPDVPPK